jgi:hypothetical protein
VKHLSRSALKGRLLALPLSNRPGCKRLASSKHSSLLRKFVTYGRKKFYNIGPQVTLIVDPEMNDMARSVLTTLEGVTIDSVKSSNFQGTPPIAGLPNVRVPKFPYLQLSSKGS